MVDTDVIRLTIPASNAYARLPRVAIVGLATRAGFTYDEVEDLRVAMGEACRVVLEDAPTAGWLTVTFTVGRGTLVVDLERSPNGGPSGISAERRLTALSVAPLLATTTDAVERPSPGHLRFRRAAADD